MTRVFVPKDSAALAVGAEAVAGAIADEAARRGLAVEIVRTGSRGLFWLEPMVEVETGGGAHRLRPGGGARRGRPVRGGLPGRRPSPLRIGRPEDHPWLAGQTRITFARCGIVDPALPRRLPRPRRPGGPGAGAGNRPGRHHRSHDPLGPARPRRRGLPRRGEVEDGGAGARRAQIHRLQRRRGRQRHLRRPHDHGGRSLRPDRGHGHRRPGGGGGQGLRLFPLRISPRQPRLRRGHRGGARRRRARRFRSGAARRRGRLCLRRGDGAAGKPGGQARPGARQAAAAGPQGAVRPARRWSTTCSPWPRRRGSWRTAARPMRPWASAARAGTQPIQLAGNVKQSRPLRSALRPHPGRDRRATSAAGRPAAGRCGRCSAAGRWGPISRPPCSTRPTTTRPSRPGTA